MDLACRNRMLRYAIAGALLYAGLHWIGWL